MAAVESIYSSLILDTKQYEEALRRIVGLSKAAESSFQQGFDVGKKKADETTQAVNNTSRAIKALASVASFGAIIAGFKGMIDSAVQAESQIKGLSAVVANKFGQESVPKAISMVNKLSAELGLTKEAVSQAMKNFSSMNFTLDQQEKLLRGAADIAVDNRQSHYDLSESVKVWSEGVKNNNSVLSDSIGISENLAAQYKRLGVNTDTLTNAQAGAADRQKVVNDFTNQFSVFTGRATENLQGYAGATNALNKSTSELSIALGQILRDAVTPLMMSLASAAKVLTTFVQGMDSAQKQTVVFGAGVLAVGAAFLSLNTTLSFFAPAFAAKLAVMSGGVTVLASGIALLIGQIAAMKYEADQATKNAGDSLGFAAAAGKIPEVITKLEGIKKNVRELGEDFTSNGQIVQEWQKELRALGVDTSAILTINQAGIRVNSEALDIALKKAKELRNVPVPNKPKNISAPSSGKPAKENNEPNLDWWTVDTGQLTQIESLGRKIGEQFSATSRILSANGMYMEKFAATTKTASSVISAIGSSVSEVGQAMLKLSQVKLQNITQTANFMSAGLSQLMDAQHAATQKEYQDQLDALTAQSQALLDQERSYLIEREKMKAEFDDSAKAENDRLFQQALDAMTADYEAKKNQNDANAADNQQRIINDQQLDQDYYASKTKLRADFDQKLLTQIQNNDKNLEANDKAQADKKAAQELEIQNQKNALEKKKQDDDKKAAEEKKNLDKLTRLYEWNAGKTAFEFNKRIQNAMLDMQFATVALNSAAGIAQAFAEGGPPGAIIGGIVAGGILTLAAVAYGMSKSAVNSAQYPPPPVFADGGIATGPSIFGEAGPELAIPMKNPGKDFGALKSEVAKNLTQNSANTTNVYIDGVKVMQGYNLSPRELANQTAEIIRNDIYQAVSR